MHINELLPMLTEFQEKSREISKFILPDWIDMKSQIHKEQINLTLFVAYGLCEKTINLKLAMYTLLREKNIYATKVLYRALIEHNVKTQYFIINPRQMSNLGEFYLKFAEVEEYISMIKAQRAFSAIHTSTEDSHWDKVFEAYPHLKDKKQEINEAIQMFGFKNMTIEIANHLKEHAENLNHFENMLRNYWLCSPFVHGGPGVENSLYESLSNLKTEEEADFTNLIQIPFYMAYENMQFIFFQGRQYSSRSKACYDHIGSILTQMKNKYVQGM